MDGSVHTQPACSPKKSDRFAGCCLQGMSMQEGHQRWWVGIKSAARPDYLSRSDDCQGDGTDLPACLQHPDQPRRLLLMVAALLPRPGRMSAGCQIFSSCVPPCTSVCLVSCNLTQHSVHRLMSMGSGVIMWKTMVLAPASLAARGMELGQLSGVCIWVAEAGLRDGFHTLHGRGGKLHDMMRSQQCLACCLVVNVTTSCVCEADIPQTGPCQDAQSLTQSWRGLLLQAGPHFAVPTLLAAL